MSEKARILIFGFSAAESERIDLRLAEIGVPAPLRLQKRHAGAVIGDILRDASIGPIEAAEPIDRIVEGEFDYGECLVLFHNVSDAGVGSLMQVFKSLEIPKPIFAVVTKTSINWTLSRLMEHLIEEKRAHEGSK